ncbi:hypothetical protein B296_00019717 [Ensete ventricosum]|uniref:Uncharacterized protein n=1 Tax=Ensete ventricosum TaxID=4639 RepID=A0A426XUZ1_ENSVE|nr:hypothetical protein B296_00019717 [Ensete ventricosum]
MQGRPPAARLQPRLAHKEQLPTGTVGRKGGACEHGRLRPARSMVPPMGQATGRRPQGGKLQGDARKWWPGRKGLLLTVRLQGGGR